MTTGLYIMMSKDKAFKGALTKSLKYGIYGFLMKPVVEGQPDSRSKHYPILSDYACCEEGTHVFFFYDREVYYGGIITNENKDDSPTFYLNGKTSPLGKKANSEFYYEDTYKKSKEETYIINNNEKAIPFTIEFKVDSELTGKKINVDDLYWELSQYNYPLPINSIQGLAMATLTPKETEILLNLLKNSDEKVKKIEIDEPKIYDDRKTLFSKEFVKGEKQIYEAHLEFLLLSQIELIKKIIPDGEYTRCRQIPVCPFKSKNYDRVDIALYDKNNRIKDGTLPNIIIELKNKDVSYEEYKQVNRYLKWLEKVADDEFERIQAYLIGPKISENLNKPQLKRRGINTRYFEKIKLVELDDLIKQN